MSAALVTPRRCAIYTRKSTEHGLEQDFNSLEAQREACEAYVKSQAHEGWRLDPERYDDGGFSGGSLDRPGLQRLLDAIRERRIDVVVVYKVDRLTRALADFAKLVELFDQHAVSFVSVTQSFNTTTSMGRLTLNVLLSFAQFEREVTGERIRDKIAASKKRGLRVGGPVPLGYEVRDKRLVVLGAEAEQVRFIFERYLELGCLTGVARDLRARGIVTKVTCRRDGTTRGGIAFTTGPLAYLLRNRVYIGEVTHKGRHYPGTHQPIIARDRFDAVQEKLSAKANRRGMPTVNRASLLTGRIFDDRGNRMSPATARKGGARYRYYVSCALMQGRKEEAGSVARVPAPEIEAIVLDALGERRRSADHELEGVPCPADLIVHTVKQVIVRAGTIEIVLKGAHADEHSSPVLVTWSPQPQTRRRAVIGAGGDRLVRPIRAATRARLVEGIARARHWVEQLLTGDVKDTHDIARREGCSERSVRMIVNLAFLAPDIVRSAVDGSLPHGLGITKLTETPLSWTAQKNRLSLG